MKWGTIFIAGGDPEASNESSLYRSGELGLCWEDPQTKRKYQRVKLDSGATASASSGVVAAGQLAFWKDAANYLVTNDLRFSARNRVAGIFTMAVTAGYYTLIVKRARGYNVKAANTSPYLDAQVIANSGTSADITPMAVGTAPTYNVVGVGRAERSGTTVSTDVDIEPDVE